MAGKKSAKSTPALERRELIRQITANQTVAVGKLAEAQSYAPARALIIDPRLGLGVPPDSVVVDAPVPFGRERPDIQIWLEGVPVALRNESEHLYAILELKSGTKVRDGGRAIARSELETYSYGKLRYFYLADAEVIQRYDLGGVDLPPAREVRWTELEDDDLFVDFFSPLTPDRRTLRAQLREFASMEIPLGRSIVKPRDRKRFVDAIVTTARVLSSAVSDLVDRKLVPDLMSANAAIEEKMRGYGPVSFDFGDDDPLHFPDEPHAGRRSEHAAFNAAYTDLLSTLENKQYALHAEHEGLPAYAERSGLKAEHASFLLVDSKNSETKATSTSARASYVQETATLLFSRLLMIRFSEDHGLLPRILSNGGLSTFARFAQQVDEPFQTLVQTAYRRAHPIYRHLFEPKALDWLLHDKDEVLSETLLHVMWILAGWDFTTVRGDILSGIYDRNLDASQRRALGEVYTRPELAEYMLQACGYDGTQTVLDPACGSGTFLVEAFEAARRRKEAAGVDFGSDDVVETLKLLHGMDVNAFSATLAQIQLLWHVLSTSHADQVGLMRQAIKALAVEGGRSSLETWGASMAVEDLFDGEAGRESEETRAANVAHQRRLRNADRRFRDMSSRRAGFQIVTGNPPFVRVHRLRITEAQKIEYQDVRRKQTDLAVLFTYRAMKWWLAPGGRLGFYLPLAISESAYGEPLREIMAQHTIIEIIDLEEIGNVAFHGANIVTMGLVVEKSPSPDDHHVKITRVTASCLDGETGRIDMSRATSDLVPAAAIALARYLPTTASTTVGGMVTRVHAGATDHAEDGGASAGATAEIDEPAETGADDEEAHTSDTAWLTKVRAADVPILDLLSKARRLDAMIMRGWKRTGRRGTRFAAEIPAGDETLKWRSARVMGYGVKIGGKMPAVEDGLPVYRAKSLPPDGTLGTKPAGQWNGDPALVDTVRFYAWDGIGDTANTFAIRNIATQPVFAPHPQNAYLTNTVYCIRLAERFPLNIWSISHVIAWYMALTARTSVVQGFFVTYYPRQTIRMPVPGAVTDDLRTRLDDLGTRIFAADDELTRGDEALESVRNEESEPLRKRLDLIETNAISSPKDVSWPSDDADWSGVQVIANGDLLVFAIPNESGQPAPAPTITGAPCEIVVADPDLRAWVFAEASSRLAEGRKVDRAWMQQLPIPNDPAAGRELLRRREDKTALNELREAVHDLDKLVAKTLGLSCEQLAHIGSAFDHDGIMRHITPHWRHNARR